MKLHPSVVEGEIRLDDQSDIEERITQLAKVITADMDAQRSWMNEQAFYRWRRHGAGDPGRRGVSAPWIGASDFVFQMSEVYCNQFVAPNMQMFFGTGGRHVRVEPYDERGHRNAKNVERVMNAWARGGGKHAQSDLKLQMAMMLESVAQSGRGILRSSYEYLCRVNTESIRRSDLPGPLAKLAIIPDITPAERRMMMQQIPALNSPDVLQFLGAQQPVQPLDRETLKQFMPKIKQGVIDLYGLDMEESVDRQACADVLDYLKSGTKDRSHVITTKFVEQDGPRLHNVDVGDLIVPLGAGMDLSRTNRLGELLRFPRERLATLAQTNDWRNIDEILSHTGGGPVNQYDSPLAGELQNRIGIMQTPDNTGDLVDIVMVHHYEPVTGAPADQGDVQKWEDRPQRLVCSLYHPYSRKVLAKYAVSGGMPYTGFYFEAKYDDYHAASGIPKLLRDPESHATAIIRTLENVMTLISYPTFQIKRNKFNEAEGFEVPPGGVIPVDQAGDLQQLPMQSNTFPAERLLQSILLMPERIVGGTDQNITDDAHLERPRTKAQMQMIDSARMRLIGMKSMLLLDQYAKCLRLVRESFLQYGPDEFIVATSGAPPQKMTMAQIRGEMDVLPWPAVADMDPNFRKEQAMAMFQVLTQVMPLLQGDPTTVPQPAEAARRVIEEFDPQAARAILPDLPPDVQDQMMERAKQEDAQKQQIAQLAQMALENAPLNPEQIQMLFEEIGKLTGRKELQMVVASAQQSRQQTDQMTTASALNGSGA